VDEGAIGLALTTDIAALSVGRLLRVRSMVKQAGDHHTLVD